jgi:hypothetical protein
MGFEITPSGITITDPLTGQVRVKMGVLGDMPVARGRLYVLGQPQIAVELANADYAWGTVRLLRQTWGAGAFIYMWQEGQSLDCRWRLAMENGWRYSNPPAEIALANYLLEGE